MAQAKSANLLQKPGQYPSSPLDQLQSAVSSLRANYGNSVKQLLTVAISGLALWLLYREFSSVKVTDIQNSFQSMTTRVVALSLTLTILNFVIMIGYDWLAVKQVSHPLSLKQISLVSFLYYAFSNTFGTILGGAPVRIRLYSNWGMKPNEIVRLLYLIAYAFWLGLFAVGGILFLVFPFQIPDQLHLPLSNSRPFGIILLSIAGVLYGTCFVRRKPIQILHVDFQPPPFSIAGMQSLISAADFLLAAGALYVLLPSDLEIPFLQFAAIYILAITAALISHVPGGLGVLELVLVTMLPYSKNGLVASLIAYRIIYYLIPTTAAVITIAVGSATRHALKIGKFLFHLSNLSFALAPRLLTVLMLSVGVFMFVNGTLQSVFIHPYWLDTSAAVLALESLVLYSSLLGAILMVLSVGLHWRVNGAWAISLVALSISIVGSLLTLQINEWTVVLVALFLGLIPCREYFARKSLICTPQIHLKWVSQVALTVAVIFGLALFTLGSEQLIDKPVWHIVCLPHLPFSDRITFFAYLGTLTITLLGLMSIAPVQFKEATNGQKRKVADLVAQSEQSISNLALLGDKHFVFSADEKAFVMYGRAGRSLISMGDPVGPIHSADDAAWEFRELCNASGMRSVFYKVDGACLGRYIEMGLNVYKIGEDARVKLKGFSLDGPIFKDLRRTVRRIEEVGLRFEIVDKANFPAILPELKKISDAWLGEKSTAEKGFSLGFFDEEYLKCHDIATISNDSGPVAFANIWRGVHGSEMSIDLMRYYRDTPRGVMEYLLSELMLRARDEHYEWFNLGMAPLSGIEPRPHGPVWNSVSSFIYEHGEHFYNFKGLRTYKSKFGPTWFPKYLACPGGMATPYVLANVATLISGGVRQLVKR